MFITRQREREEVLQALEQRFLCSPWRETTTELVFPRSLWRGPLWRRYFPAPCEEDYGRAGIPLEDPTVEKIISQTVDDCTQEQLDISWRKCDLWRVHTGAGFSPEETASHGESPHQSRRAAERNCYLLNIPLPIPPCAAHAGERIWQWQSEVEPGRVERKGGVFNVCLCFSLPKSVLTGNKLN